MQVSHETIYQELYVQGRGKLRRELTRCLRTGRALRCDARNGTIRDDKEAQAFWTREYEKGWEPRV